MPVWSFAIKTFSFHFSSRLMAYNVPAHSPEVLYSAFWAGPVIRCILGYNIIPFFGPILWHRTCHAFAATAGTCPLARHLSLSTFLASPLSTRSTRHLLFHQLIPLGMEHPSEIVCSCPCSPTHRTSLGFQHKHQNRLRQCGAPHSAAEKISQVALYPIAAISRRMLSSPRPLSKGLFSMSANGACVSSTIRINSFHNPLRLPFAPTADLFALDTS